MPETAAKDLVLFIHGFGSSAECWKTMLPLLRADEEITSRYELRCWSYPTKVVELNPLARIPSLAQLGSYLVEDLRSPELRDRNLTLVGHSQGGLVILGCFDALLRAGKASELRNVRQAILVATPCEGSTTISGFRKFMSHFIENPQEETLRVLNPEIAAMRSEIRERIVGADTDANDSWRIPIHAFCGLQDDIVPEASARGVFDSVRSVPGTHSSILEPEDSNDPRFKKLREVLLEPGGHSHRFEIEHYETVITVEPRANETIQVSSNTNPREVYFDNFGTIKRTVRFAPSNRCKKHFGISYGTRGHGYVVGHCSVHNEASATDKGLWEDHGTTYRFEFVPGAEKSYCLQVDIYNGFDKDSRDVHFHLLNDAYRRHMTYVLDLSKYVSAGYSVSDGPRFYLDPENTQHHELCGKRTVGDGIPPEPEEKKGVYRWELQNVREGVVDIVWNVAKAGE
jgi:pimeloyl-ACP methyl ester carboxylesterase